MVKITEGLDGLSLLSLIGASFSCSPRQTLCSAPAPGQVSPCLLGCSRRKEKRCRNFKPYKTFYLPCRFPDGSDGEESDCNAGNPGSIPGPGRFLGEGNGNPLQYCLENPMDRGAWWATVGRVAKSRTQLKQLGTHSVLLPGKSHGQRSLVGCRPWGREESHTTE